MREERILERPHRVNLDFTLPNLVEVTSPLEPGSKLFGRRIYEVRRIQSTCTVAGKARPLFVAVHEKDHDQNMLTMFVCFGKQKSWCSGVEDFKRERHDSTRRCGSRVR